MYKLPHFMHNNYNNYNKQYNCIMLYCLLVSIIIIIFSVSQTTDLLKKGEKSNSELHVRDKVFIQHVQ